MHALDNFSYIESIYKPAKTSPLFKQHVYLKLKYLINPGKVTNCFDDFSRVKIVFPS